MAPVEEGTVGLLEQKAIGAISVKNILFATDFSESSENALPYATALCRRFDSTLHAVHVFSDATLLMMSGGVDYVSLGTIYDDAHAEAAEKLERMSLRLGSIPHRCHVRHGKVWKNLAGIIEENDIGLIVVGTHGRTGLPKLLLGSVAEDVLRHASCPVLTVGPKISGHAKLPALQADRRDIAPADLDLRDIVLATNLAVEATRAARVAVRLAGEFRSRLTLLHVVESHMELATRSGSLEEGMRHVRDLIPQDAELSYAPEIDIKYGSAAGGCILEIAAEQQADLIVLGAHSAAARSTHLPWSTTHRVLAHAPCPVLTVRG